MKVNILLTGLFIMMYLVLVSCIKTPVKDHEQTVATNDTILNAYDSIKAKAYGADDYGMKKYVMAFLKRGPNTSVDSIERSKLQRAHLDNITRLAEEGKLVLAGPFFGNGELRGIYVFNVQSIEEAEALTRTDPSIQEGVLIMELKEWYGSAALMEINDLHHSLSKKDI